MKYKTQPWFALLENAARTMPRKSVALALGVSAPQVSQVLNATGKYGSGEATTDKIADKVLHTFGRYVCPHLSEQSGFGPDHVVISAEQCRGYAHRPAPTANPHDMRHWQACNSCVHKVHTAPPVLREVKSRKRAQPSEENA